MFKRFFSCPSDACCFPSVCDLFYLLFVYSVEINELLCLILLEQTLKFAVSRAVEHSNECNGRVDFLLTKKHTFHNFLSTYFPYPHLCLFVLGNINAPRAVTTSAVIYCLRCLVRESIPLNQGCLNPITIIIPPGTLLSPSETAAVVGGNDCVQSCCFVVVLLWEF